MKSCLKKLKEVWKLCFTKEKISVKRQKLLFKRAKYKSVIEKYNNWNENLPKELNRLKDQWIWSYIKWNPVYETERKKNKANKQSALRFSGPKRRNNPNANEK